MKKFIFSLLTLLYSCYGFATSVEFSSWFSAGKFSTIKLDVFNDTAFYEIWSVDTDTTLSQQIFNYSDLTLSNHKFEVTTDSEYWWIPFDGSDPILLERTVYDASCAESNYHCEGTCQWIENICECSVHNGQSNGCAVIICPTNSVYCITGPGVIVKADHTVRVYRGKNKDGYINTLYVERHADVTFVKLRPGGKDYYIGSILVNLTTQNFNLFQDTLYSFQVPEGKVIYQVYFDSDKSPSLLPVGGGWYYECCGGCGGAGNCDWRDTFGSCITCCCYLGQTINCFVTRTPMAGGGGVNGPVVLIETEKVIVVN